MSRIKILCFIFLFQGLLYSQNRISDTVHRDDKGLSHYYQDLFSVGVAVTAASLLTDESKLILKHFNSLTAENAMKIGPIHPKENEYYWKDADSIVAFADRNHLKMRGHTLCWHQQTPDWLFKDQQGNQVTKDTLLARLKSHISTVVSRYKNSIYAWDVVNEAISDAPNEFYRNSLWYQICGEEYIQKAFEYAHEADPKALLFYNDYNTERAVKSEKVYQLVKKLKAQGIPIHGLGLQGHWSVYDPSREEMESAFTKYSSLNLPIQITELDISIYKPEPLRRPKNEMDIDVFTPELEEAQLEKYKMVFDLFRKYKNHITGISFWNISDRRSWLDNFPVRGRKNYPLLFDQNLQPKNAYWELIKFER